MILRTTRSLTIAKYASMLFWNPQEATKMRTAALAGGVMCLACVTAVAQQSRVRIGPCTKGDRLYLVEKRFSKVIFKKLRCGQKVRLLNRGSIYSLIRVGKREGYVPSAYIGSPSGEAATQPLQRIANNVQAYIRATDPRLPSCDSHGGFVQHQTVNESPGPTLTDQHSNQAEEMGPITKRYLICKDGTRVQE